MINPTLKPCPFCGCAMKSSHEFLSGKNDFVIFSPRHAENCLMHSALHYNRFDFSNYEEFIEAWNTRAEVSK